MHCSGKRFLLFSVFVLIGKVASFLLKIRWNLFVPSTRFLSNRRAMSSSSTILQDLYVVNYNIDGLGEDVEQRTQACVNLLLQLNPLPHVICLQEVIPSTMYFIIGKLQTRYISRSCNPLGSYFTMIFTRDDITYLSGARQPFRCGSSMGRDILHARISVNGRPVTIYTSHLESCKDSASVRCRQFKEIHTQLIGSSDPALYCGDSNLSYNVAEKKTDEEIAVGRSGLLQVDDAYYASKANEGKQGLSTTWSRLNEQRTRSYTSRFDRFYSNKRDIVVVPVSQGGFRLYGKDKLPDAVIPNALVRYGYATPSDHYMVSVVYRVTPGDPQELSNTGSAAATASSSSSSSSPSFASPTEVAPASIPDPAIDVRRRLAAAAADKRASAAASSSVTSSSSSSSSSSASVTTSAIIGKANDPGGEDDDQEDIQPRKIPKIEAKVLSADTTKIESKSVTSRSQVIINLADDDEVALPCPPGYDADTWAALPKEIQQELS